MKRAAKLTAGLIPFIYASPAFAQDYTIAIPKPPGFQIEDLGLLVSRGIGIALLVAGVLVFAYLVWGGIQWITSGGDKAKTEESRSRITAALIGLAIVAAAWAVMQLISYFFGVDVLGGGTTIEPGY